MLALAVVLLLIVGLLVIVSFAGTSEEIVIEFLMVTITTSVGGVFFAGVVCGLIALASALALRRSWRLHQARAEEVRELRRLAGIPDPDESESATVGSATASQVVAESGSASSTKGEHDGTETARADSGAPSGDSNDTVPLPNPEDPPRT